MEHAAVAAASLSAALLAQPLHGFVLICWAQPTSFVAHFARRRIESVTDLFVKRFSGDDTHNTPDYNLLRLSTRSLVVHALLRGAVIFVAARPAFLASSSSSVGETTSTTAKTVALRAGAALAVTAALIPAQLIYTIFSTDTSGGYKNQLRRVYHGLLSSAVNEWDRAHPAYQSGTNPWKVETMDLNQRRRPHPLRLIVEKLWKIDAFPKTFVPWTLYGVGNAAVSVLCQHAFLRNISSEAAETNKTTTKTTTGRRIARTLLRVTKIFTVAALAHGAFAYALAPYLARGTRAAILATDYTMPYTLGPGSEADPVIASSSLVTTPGRAEVPRVNAFYALVEAVMWGSVTTFAVMKGSSSSSSSSSSDEKDVAQ